MRVEVRKFRDSLIFKAAKIFRQTYFDRLTSAKAQHIAMHRISTGLLRQKLSTSQCIASQHNTLSLALSYQRLEKRGVFWQALIKINAGASL